MMASGTDYLKLHFIVFLWGFSAVFGKLVTIPAVEMVFFRAMLAAIGMGIVIYFSRGEFSVSRSDLIKLILIGFVVSLHWLTFFGAARVSNVSVSLVGFATNSLWTAVLEPLFKGNKIKKYEVFLGCTVLFGLCIIFSFDFQYRLGLFLGILAGFTSALFSIFNSKLVARIGARTITFYEMIGVFIGTAMFFPLYKIIWNHELQLIPAPLDWLWIAMLAIVCSVYAYTVAIDLMKRISVFMIQLTLNLEPLYGILMAVIIFGDTEKMNINFYVGTFVILTAVVTYPFLKKKLDYQ